MQKHFVLALAAALSVAGLTARIARADREIIVQPGDSMQSISLRYYGDVDHVSTITRYNNLASPDLIYAGLRLVLPELPDSGATAVTTNSPASTVATATSPADPLSSGISPPGQSPLTVAIPLPVLTAPGSPDAYPVSGAGQTTGTLNLAIPGLPIDSGLATWYGPGFVGGVTFCGEIYDQTSYTAASNTLPCGSVVVVTNQNTGQSVRVRVNDRGGFGTSLVLDLSWAAFRTLAPNSVGVIPVTVSTPAR